MLPQRQLAFLRPVSFLMVFAVMLCTGVGCGLPQKWHFLANQLPQATPQDPATYVFCVWEPAEGVDPEGKPTRGFAGKITFFTRQQSMGVRIKGDVRVTVYDDQGKPEERGKPIHHWDFQGDAWAIHLQDSQLGAAYSVFIPYSRKGNHRAQCALQVRFTPEVGAPVYSDTVAVLLEGPVGKKADKPLNGNASADKRSSLTSITIPLKEKRKTDLANMPLGQMEVQRTVAPVSELALKQQALARQQALTNGQVQQSGGETPEANSPVMTTLPSAPRAYTPAVMPPQPLIEDQTAKPLPPATPAANGPPQTPNPFQSRQRPLQGDGHEADGGSNPFNR